MAEWIVKKDNYGMVQPFEIKKADGTAYNLTDYTVTIKVWDGGALKFSGACSVTDAAAGLCKYTPASDDFDTVGEYYGELELTKAGVIVDTETFTVKVIPTAPAP